MALSTCSGPVNTLLLSIMIMLVLAPLLHSLSCLVEAQKLGNVQNAPFTLPGHKILDASILERLQLGLGEVFSVSWFMIGFFVWAFLNKLTF